MRILHTSDWHLNNRLYRINRQPDIKERLVELAGYLSEHRVDVMVVAGDLFSQQHHRTDELQAAIADVCEVFKPFLLRKGTIVAISGNHDDENLFSLLHSAQDLSAPLDKGDRGPRPPGRMYLGAQATLLPLQCDGGQIVQFVLLPYPTVQRYLRGEQTSFASPDEKHSRLQQALIERLERMRARLDPRHRSVMVAHAHVRGSQIHTLYQIDEKDDVVFDPAHLPGNFAYTAYGHIHKAQPIAGSERIRYSGSIERMDLHERADQKSAVLVEIGKDGTSDPVCLPLRATPIYQPVITDPEADLRRLRDECPDHDRALVYYTVVYTPDQNHEAICREVESLFPRWCDRKLVPACMPAADPEKRGPDLQARLRDVRGTVCGYLRERLSGHPSQDGALALVEQLMQEVQP